MGIGSKDGVPGVPDGCGKMAGVASVPMGGGLVQVHSPGRPDEKIQCVNGLSSCTISNFLCYLLKIALYI